MNNEMNYDNAANVLPPDQQAVLKLLEAQIEETQGKDGVVNHLLLKVPTTTGVPSFEISAARDKLLNKASFLIEVSLGHMRFSDIAVSSYEIAKEFVKYMGSIINTQLVSRRSPEDIFTNIVGIATAIKNQVDTESYRSK